MSWEYYPRRSPKPVKEGIKAKSKRGDIGETWWSHRWIGILKSFHMGARLNRGKAYARRGQVVSIDIEKGAVFASVQGTRKRPYSVTILLPELSDDEWDKVTDALASQALFAAKLLSGEMPTTIEDAFDEVDVSLFPQSRKELDTECSCPDWANPCKHIAAVYFLLAEQFDEDPFLIFTLRGRTKEEIISILREKRAEKLSKEDMVSETDINKGALLEECLDTYWEAGEALDSFTINPINPEVENIILKRLGKAPFTVRGENAVSLLMKIYHAVSAAALQKASEE
ncbi:MAG: SWIM zinc finger family protein [Theionarchaea archaeon]|nr:SWIM zinc finger family protein [Theionarchaea archaeon]